jgi:opacity protein-like surface antigen
MMHAMKTSARLLAPVVLVALSAPALAQVYTVQPLPVQWFVDGGPSFPLGTTSDYFNTGWTVGGGFTLRQDPGQPFSLRTELDYSRFGAASELISAGQAAGETQINGGYAEALDAQVDGVFEQPLNAYARVYALGGIGLAYRHIELTQSGATPCNEFLGVCGPGFGGSTTSGVAGYDTTRFAWNVGAGLDFPLPGGQSWFVEARYERIETPEATEFLPIRIGIRF